MSKYDFSDFDEPQKSYDFSDFDEQKPQEQPKEESTMRQLARASIDTIVPVAGAIGGAAIAAPGSVGLASIPAGAMGYAAGKQGARLLKHYLLDDPYQEDNAVDLAKQTVGDVGEGVVMETGGALLGKGVEAAAPYVSKAMKPIGEKVMSTADSLAARALGAERATVKKLGDKKVRDVGRFALENNLLKPFSNTDDVILANQSAKQKGGQMMDDVYSQIDGANQSSFNPLETASKVDQQIGGFYRSPINKGETNQLENTLESILLRGDKNIPIKEAQAIKEELGKVANWKNNISITDKEKMAREAYSVVSKDIDAAVEAGAKNIGSEGLLNKLKSGKNLYSNAKAAEELLKNKSAREQGNNLVSLTDSILLGAGGAGSVATGGAGIVPTIAAFGAKKYGEKYGAQQAALALDKVGKAISKTTIKNVPEASKAASNVIVGQFAPRPEAKGVERWIAKGQERVFETDASLDPEYLRQLPKTKQGKDLLIRASEISPKSAQMQRLVEQIKTSEEYKKHLRQKEKSAQGKEPDQSSVKPQMKFPQVLQKDGFTAVVRNINELDEARSEGWA